MSDGPLLVITWSVGGPTGWGNYSTQICRHALASGRARIALTEHPTLAGHDPVTAALLNAIPVLAPRDIPRDAVLLEGLGNGGVGAHGRRPVVYGRRTIGVVFFEDTRLTAEDVTHLANFDRLIAGSTWNADLLRAVGLTNVLTVLQGVDLDAFTPRDGPRDPDGRFRIFSGGKLEYRKGQDIVIAAFRLFRERHPEANGQLVTAWANLWPQTIAGLAASPYVTNVADLASGHITQARWLAENGVPEDAVEDVGLLPHRAMPNVLRSCDVAVFPNRAEGGTSLPTMEALACGLPTLCANGTGLRDLFTIPWAVATPGVPVTPGAGGYAGTDGWVEADPDNVAIWLRDAWEARANLPLVAQAAGDRDLSDWSWQSSIMHLLDAAGVP